MPKFVLTPIEHDPFDPTELVQYAGKVGGAPNPAANAASLGKLVGGIASRVASLPQRMIGEPLEQLGNSLMGQSPELPIDPVSGQPAPMDPRLIDSANALGGLVMEGGVGVPKEPNSLGIFGGVNAKTADMDALQKALRYERTQMSPDDIWRKTGWGRGADGKWRFEIPDHSSKFDPSAVTKPMKPSEWEPLFAMYKDEYAQGLGSKNFDHLNGGERLQAVRYAQKQMEERRSKLGDVLDHPELYAAYPSLKGMKVRPHYGENSLGMYNPIENQLEVAPADRIASSLSGQNGHDIVLHEIQHAVQSRENFGHGGSPSDPAMELIGNNFKDQVRNQIRDLKDKREKLGMLNVDDTAELLHLQSVASKIWGGDPHKLGYQVLEGEVESRNVQDRFLNKKAGWIPPWQTEDIPRKWQHTRKVPQWARSPED